MKSDFCGFAYDHRWSLPQCFLRHGGFVQGNFDQTLLFLKEKEFSASLSAYLEIFQKLNEDQRAGWVCSLGHGVLPQTPETHVKNFVKIVRESFR